MSHQMVEQRRKLLISPNNFEHVHTESSHRTSVRGNEPLFSFPQSPKFSMNMISELQNTLRQKEIDLVECTKIKKRLEYELSETTSQIFEKDSELKRLYEENLKLKSQITENEYNLSDYWKREVVRKSEGLKKYQEQVRTQGRENKAKAELELKKIFKQLEDEKKNYAAKVDLYERQLQVTVNKLRELERENSLLKNDKTRSQEIDFEKQLQELEVMQGELLQENTCLKQEIEIIRRGNNLQDLALLSADINKISRQVHHLLMILKNFKQGKDISIYLMLEMDEVRAISSSRQLILDIAQLKKDLSEIRAMVSDYQAEIVGGNMCATQ